MVYWCGVKQVHIYCINRRTLTVWLVPITSHSYSSHYSHICRFICDSDANLQTTANQSQTQRQTRKRCEATLQYFSRASHRLLWSLTCIPPLITSEEAKNPIAHQQTRREEMKRGEVAITSSFWRVCSHTAMTQTHKTHTQHHIHLSLHKCLLHSLVHKHRESKQFRLWSEA